MALQKTKTKRLTILLSALCLVVSGVGAAFVSNKHASAACSPPATNYGQVATTVNVPANGTYRIWSRVMAPDSTNNSYHLEVDGGTCYTVGDSAIAANTWTWVDYQNASVSSKLSINLTAGTHNLKLIGREANVKVDRVLALADANCVPSGVGDNCSTSADTTAPVVALSAPAANATISGTANVAATASDATGVTKVDFYVDNTLKATDTAAPYSYSLDTLQLTNGSHSLSVKAYDAAGNTGSDSRTVTVKNGDTVAPGAPTQLKATADSFNKVSLTWAASTDNVAVTGYTILRNGSVINTVGAVTSFADTTVLPNTQYSYQIKAYDAAGNSSANSSAATAKTPTAPDTQAPSVPQGVSAAAKSTSQIDLTWIASTDNVAVAGYDVYRSSTGGAITKVAAVTTTKFGDTGLKADTTYTYYVVARDANGNSSAHSQTASAATPAEPKPSDPGTPPDEQQYTGVIRGKVTGKRNRPLSGVKVTMWADGKRYHATTNNRGVYRFDSLPAGRYSVSYRADGYRKEEATLRARENKQTVNNVRLYENGARASWWDRLWR